MDSEQMQTMSYEVAEAIAPTWERRREAIEEVTAPVRAWMVERLAPRHGETVLELAAGVGDTGFEVAARLGEEGMLISTDFSPRMLEAARRRGAKLGVANVDYRVIDAQRIELAADSVDGVLCRYGFMLMPDQAAALAETRRVLRPGGRLALAVWGPPERNPFFTLVGAEMVARGLFPPPQPPPAPGLFSMADEERTTALLHDAGFDDVQTEELPVAFGVTDAGAYLDFVADTAGPLALAVRALADDERERIRARLEEALAPFATERGYEVPGLALAALAR
jgi:ubiquinone/menaquinone biosynthesis C-methylase UbiE